MRSAALVLVPTAFLLALLVAAADGSSIGCVCRRLEDGSSGWRGDDANNLWSSYCRPRRSYWLLESCETLSPPSVAVAVVRRLVPAGSPVPPPGAEEEEEEEGVAGACAGALGAAAALCGGGHWAAFWNFSALVAADWTGSCSAHGLGDAAVLADEPARRALVSQLLAALVCVSRAADARNRHADLYQGRLYDPGQHCATAAKEPPVSAPDCTSVFSSYWQDTSQLLALGIGHLSRLLVPLAFEHMANGTSGQLLDKWVKDMERVRDMLHVKMRGWLDDVQSVSRQIAHYRMEQDENDPEKYVLRRPLLSDKLLEYHQRFLSFRDDFTTLCQQQQPKASDMFGLADAMFSFYNRNWFERTPSFKKYISSHIQLEDEEWQLEDQSNVTLSMDTECLQLLADSLDRPRCPLEELPPDAISLRLQCRRRLWQDMVLRLPHIPVTSYLAYTQRASVNICLLAWMVANSFGICEDVPSGIVQSVHDARCYFDSPDNESCPQSNATDAICFVSRAILLLKCRDFSFQKHFDECYIKFSTRGSHATAQRLGVGDRYRGNREPTERTLSYRDTLNEYTLKYRNFKIESLKLLEISFVAVNIVFRFATAGIYAYLPQLRNLPGKVLLTYQVTGLVQVVCSEVVYRMAGVPGLTAAVQVDSALTLLGCLWLNVFCYQVYGYVRHLRLPNDLTPTEASKKFRRQVLYALIPWSVICAACIALEETSKFYLFHGRVLFLLAISLSVAFNLVCLTLVAYMYARTRKSMRQLKVYDNGKLGSKKQVVFLSVKSIILSGVGVIIRVGFHQAQGIAQFVYYVHIATMVQGPLLFVFFVCNGTALPALKNRALACRHPDVIRPGQELCSAAERNLAVRRNKRSLDTESTV